MDQPVVLGIGEIVWDCLPGKKALGGAPVYDQLLDRILNKK